MSASPPQSLPTSAREGQTLAGTSRWVTYANFVKLPHTVFALPFALVGVVLASYDTAVRWPSVLWVVVAFTTARFAAMGFNRIVDREIDARNPRTKMREIPAGYGTRVPLGQFRMSSSGSTFVSGGHVKWHASQ